MRVDVPMAIDKVLVGINLSALSIASHPFSMAGCAKEKGKSVPSPLVSRYTLRSHLQIHLSLPQHFKN